MRWWTRPLVRAIAAVVLPFLVPAIIIGILWSLPGNPAEIICPGCSGTEELAARWRLDQGPAHFYRMWLADALSLDLGKSWTLFQGMSVNELMGAMIPKTAALVALASVPILLATVLTALGWLPKRLDALWQGLGVIPSVILALVFAAIVTIQYGAMSTEGWPGTLRLLLGALVLGVADGALSGAVTGTRSIFERERKQRYVSIAILRGERELPNTLPNVLPALVGQLRGRILHLLSGAVIVEVVLSIDGLGALLWSGTLKQDYGLVLAAVWVVTVLSSLLLFLQVVFEVIVAMAIRRAPAVPA